MTGHIAMFGLLHSHATQITPPGVGNEKKEEIEVFVGL